MRWTADSVEYRAVSMDAAYKGYALLWHKGPTTKIYQLGDVVSYTNKPKAGDLIVFYNPQLDAFISNEITEDYYTAYGYNETAYTYSNYFTPTRDSGGTINDSNGTLLVGLVENSPKACDPASHFDVYRTVVSNYYDKSYYITGLIYKNQCYRPDFDHHAYSGSLVKSWQPDSYIKIDADGCIEYEDGNGYAYHLGEDSHTTNKARFFSLVGGYQFRAYKVTEII